MSINGSSECVKNTNKFQTRQFFIPNYQIEPTSFRVLIEKTKPINHYCSLINASDNECEFKDKIKDLIEYECNRIYNDFGITAKLEMTSLDSADYSLNLQNFSIEFLISSYANILDTPCIEKSFEILSFLIQNLFREKQKKLDISSLIFDVLASKACRYAIKFNDDISKCNKNIPKAITKLLGECRDPYHCAHGRPTLIPICDIMLL